MTVSDRDLSVFPDFQQYVLLTNDYFLGYMYDTRNYLKKLAETENREPSVEVFGRKVIVDDVAVDLDLVGGMYRQLLERIKISRQRITRGLCDSDTRLQITLPHELSDRPNSQEADFWFAELYRNGFSDMKDAMLDALLNHKVFSDFCFLKTGPSTITINAPGCHEFLGMCADHRLCLWAASHISAGAPNRGSEVISQTFRNSPGGNVRNVKVIDGRLCIVGTYNKTEGKVSASIGRARTGLR